MILDPQIRAGLLANPMQIDDFQLCQHLRQLFFPQTIFHRALGIGILGVAAIGGGILFTCQSIQSPNNESTSDLRSINTLTILGVGIIAVGAILTAGAICTTLHARRIRRNDPVLHI